MKLTISNKTLKSKPSSDKEKGTYFKDIQFKTGNFDLPTIKKIIESGYTLTYLYKDDVFTRKDSYMKNNYLGTQFICVDIDECDKDLNTFVLTAKYKPTFAHTTFSNKTAVKGFKNCFHLYYCFDSIIYNESNFNSVFAQLTNDYAEDVDKCAKDCHRCIFTTNSTLDNYEWYNSDNIYKVNDFVKEESDDLDNFFNENDGWEKIDCLDISTTSNNISKESKISQNKNNEKKPIRNEFSLDEAFFNDLNSLERSDFLFKYDRIYPYYTETYIDETEYVNGYADLRNKDYYQVPSAQYRWNGEKAEISKITNGKRNTVLWMDAIAFMKIVPNITKEHLVYLLVKEVYLHFINNDGQLNNWYVINKAKEVWNNIDNLDAKSIKKSFKIDKNYWLQKGMNNWLEVTRIIRKEMKDEEFGSIYDFSKTVEENMKDFKEYGISTKKATLIKWLTENNLEYMTDKDVRNKMIMDLYNEDKTRSSRNIEKLMLDNGIKTSYRTIQNVIN